MTVEEFFKIELKIGTILRAEIVENSEKLLKLSVDFGEGEPRQILSGIAKSYAPESLVGRQSVFVTNLDPRAMMGLESNGMLVAASDAQGHPVILAPDTSVAPGTTLK